MTFEGAVIKEQNVTFALVVVKSHVTESSTQANDTIRSFMPVFPGIPVVLMSQDGFGGPQFYGRRDIVNFPRTAPGDSMAEISLELRKGTKHGNKPTQRR